MQFFYILWCFERRSNNCSLFLVATRPFCREGHSKAEIFFPFHSIYAQLRFTSQFYSFLASVVERISLAFLSWRDHWQNLLCGQCLEGLCWTICSQPSMSVTSVASLLLLNSIAIALLWLNSMAMDTRPFVERSQQG